MLCNVPLIDPGTEQIIAHCGREEGHPADHGLWIWVTATEEGES